MEDVEDDEREGVGEEEEEGGQQGEQRENGGGDGVEEAGDASEAPIQVVVRVRPRLGAELASSDEQLAEVREIGGEAWGVG
jgi:hypothetical protein